MAVAARTTRDRAILAVLLGAGLRVAEAVGLDPSDLHEDSEGASAIYVRQGKGRKDRTVPIQPEVATAICRHLAETKSRIGDEGPLFRAHDRAESKRPRGRLTTRAVAEMVARCAKDAGIEAKRVSPTPCATRSDPVAPAQRQRCLELAQRVPRPRQRHDDAALHRPLRDGRAARRCPPPSGFHGLT